MPAPLLDRIVEEIGRSGPIGFDRYLEVVLYDPDDGFYAGGAGAAGRVEGDFLTSPEVGPLFGAVLGRALDAWWDELDRPDPFVVVEGGAGRGALAASVLRAGPRCVDAVRWVAIERSPRLAEEQRRLLAPWRERVSLVGDVGEAAAALDVAAGGPTGGRAGRRAGVVVANELLDNLPVRLARRGRHRWEELRVGVAGSPDDTPLGWVGAPLDEPSSRRLDELVPEASFGEVVPLAEVARRWVHDAVGLLDAGRVVLFDYGDETAVLARRPAWEWLRTYRHHEEAGDPLAEPGTKDVTCEVPLDQLDAPAPTEIVSQAVFLHRHGIEDLVEEGRRTWAERAHLGDLEALTARSRVREAEALCDPRGLGAFHTLTFTP